MARTATRYSILPVVLKTLPMRPSTVETHNVIYLVPVRSSRSVRLSNLKLAGRAAYRVGPRGTTMRLSVERLCAARYGMKNRLRGRLIWRRQWAQDVTGQKTYGLRRQPTADSAAAAAADLLSNRCHAKPYHGHGNLHYSSARRRVGAILCCDSERQSVLTWKSKSVLTASM